MFAPSIVFVDLETTGMSAARGRITEVGIVRVENENVVDEWSTLVNPERRIPSSIQRLTGINEEMVADAPTFAQIAKAVRERLQRALFVAHNARFDYTFLKTEFGRLGQSFSADLLCTARLSRRLYPHQRRHNLDSVMERHGLVSAWRHRALGDAKLLWDFVQALYRELGGDVVQAQVDRLLRPVYLPSGLSSAALDELPDGPGVFIFFDRERAPLHIGRAAHLRERVRAFFSRPGQSANEQRVLAAITRIDHIQTCGELGAHIREAELKETLFVLDHRRRRTGAHALTTSPLATWPFDGPVACVEVSIDQSRYEAHVFDQWRYHGSANDDAELVEVLREQRFPRLDADFSRVLSRLIARRRVRVVRLQPLKTSMTASDADNRAID